MVFHAAKACSLLEVSINPGSYGVIVTTEAFVVATDVVAVPTVDELVGASPRESLVEGGPDCKPETVPSPDALRTMIRTVSRSLLFRWREALDISEVINHTLKHC
jgi:hypothetical protein